MGLFDSGRGFIHPWWGWMHRARLETERNIGEELFFQGRDSLGNVNLLGQGATAKQGSIARLQTADLTGQAATTAAGTITGAETFEFTVDSMTGSNNTAITSHTGELGAVWNLMMASGTIAKIQSNRLRGPADDTGSTLVYGSGTPSSADYFVEATLYMNNNQGQNYDQLDAAVGARCQSTGGGEGYFFGWNYYWSMWELHGYSGGGYSILAQSSDDNVRTQYETKTLRITVTGTGATVRVRCSVDGVPIFDYNDTSGTRVTSTNRAGLLVSSDLNNFDINGVVASTAIPVDVALTGQAATARQYPILFTGNFAYDTFTDTSWLEYHTGETGTWPVAVRGSTNQWAEDGSVAYPDSNSTYYRTYNDCLTHNPANGDYIVEADFGSLTGGGWWADTLQTGIVTRMSSNGEWGYAFGYGYYGGPCWMLVKLNSIYGGHEILGSATISGGVAQTVKLVATGNGDTVVVRAYVAGTEVISYSDTAADRVLDAGKPGLMSYCYAAPYISVDNFKAYYDLTGGPLILTGQPATSAQGALTPVTTAIVTPLGRAGTTGYGALLPVIDLVPLGRSATATAGAVGYIVGGNVSVELSWLRATTAHGAPYPTEIYGALTGQQATAGDGDLSGATYLPLDGGQAVAQGGFFGVDNTFLIDTFTDSTNKDLSAHTGERGATWTVAQQTTTDFKLWLTAATDDISPSWPGGTLGTAYYRASGIAPSADYAVEVNYISTKNAGGATGYITEGVAARLNSTATAGYIFGRNPSDGYWQIDKIGTGALATVATGTLGSYQTYKLRIQVTGGATTVIKGFVDDVEVLSYSDSSSPVTAVGYAGLHHRIASTAGFPLEYPSGYFDTMRAFPAGDAVTVRPYGQRATTAQAILDPSLRLGELVGYAATTAQGSVTPRITLLSLGVGTLAPRAVRSSTTGNPDTFPGDISTAFVVRDGTAYGVGEWYDGVYEHYHARSGIFQISLLDQTTLPWVDDGGGPHGSAEEINTQSLTKFPRNGTIYALLDIHWYNSQNTLLYGWVSKPPDGDVQSAFIRDDLDANSTLVQRYLGWQEGPLYNVDGHRYVGPEVTVGVYPYVWNERTEWTNRIAPLGFYAVGTGEALMFYPRRTYAYDTGVTVHLVGMKVVTGQSYGHTPLVESNGLTLTGLRATMAQGAFYPDFTWSQWDATVALEGLYALANQPLRNGMPTGRAYPRLGIDNSQTNAPPAYRRLKDGVWGDEVVLSGATGSTHDWAYEGLMCVTHSGYADIIYVTYLSSIDPIDVYPTQIGLIVMDSRLGTVHSHTLTALTGAPSNLFHSVAARNKVQSEAVTLSNGTSVTQFMMTGHVVHLSWTYATRLSPTVTSKDGPSTLFLIPSLETLEVRGDEVYHVLFTSASNLYYNDATSTSETWTNLTNTITGDAWSDGGAYETIGHDYLSASQQGYKSWLYDHRERINDNHDGATYWMDFWASQSASYSVSSAGAVGRVTVSATPNRALTGLRATTAMGEAFPLVNGDAHAALVGKRLTAIQRCIAPPRVPFVYDTFTDTDGVYLPAHTGEIGATWTELTYASSYIINAYNELKIGEVAGAGNDGFATASGVPPSADYGVRSTLSSSNTSLSIYTNRIAQGVGVRIGGGYTGLGYFFGYNMVDGKYYLTKNNQTNIIASCDEPASPYASHTIRLEAAGTTPTQLRCYIDEVLVIEYWDTTACVTAAGSAGIVHYLYQNAPQTWYDFEAYTFDPNILILTGLNALATQGTMVASHTGGGGGTTVTLAQLRAVTSQGYLGILAGQLAGNRAAARWGTLGVVVDDGFTVEGHRATTAQGALTATPDASTSTLGRSAATAHGTLAPGVGVAYWNFIAQAVASAGVLTRSVTNELQLTGLRANTAQGGTVPTAENSDAATGRAATLAGGIVVPVLVVSLTGARAAGNTGGFVPLLAVTPEGRQAVSSQGALQLLLNIFLTGRAGTCAIGSVGYAYTGGAMLSGVYSKGELGDVTQGLWKPRPEEMLWVIAEPEEPEVEDPADEVYVRVN